MYLNSIIAVYTRTYFLKNSPIQVILQKPDSALSDILIFLVMTKLNNKSGISLAFILTEADTGLYRKIQDCNYLPAYKHCLRLKSIMKLDRKVSVITGAGRGLGRAIAVAMAREGAYTTIISRSLKELTGLKDEIEEAGGETMVVKGDVSREDDVNRMVVETMRRFGRIDILVNNAAVIGPARFVEDADSGAWEKTIGINLNGAFYCSHTICPIMVRQGGGKIVSIASGLGRMPFPRFCAYSVSKAGIIQLTRSLSEEFKARNIQVNAIDPGVMDTGMQKQIRDLGPEKLGQAVYESFVEYKKKDLLKDPGEVARLAVYLSSTEADHLTGYYGTLNDYKRRIRDLLYLH